METYKYTNEKPHNDFEEQFLNFEEDGYWFLDEFQLVPIDKIKTENVWNQARIDNAIQAIVDNIPMPPIKLYYDEELNEYRISDGIHRYNASKKAGFTHVPAIVTKKMFSPISKRLDQVKIFEKRLWKMFQKDITSELKKDDKIRVLCPQIITNIKNNLVKVEIDCFNPDKMIDETVIITIAYGGVKNIKFESKYVNVKIHLLSEYMILKFIQGNLYRIVDHYV